MAVIEGPQQPEVARHQHAVAEHVPGHVADADYRHLAGLDVAPELAEMALDELPGAAGSDAHRLVVVTGRAAGSKGITEPEAVLFRNRIGEVGKRRGPLV